MVGLKQSVPQTKDMIWTSRVLFLSMKDYQGEYLTGDNIPFSAAMLNLTEYPNVDIIVNQVSQLTQTYNCSPHLPLWLELIKCNGFLAPIGMWFGLFSSWLFRQGFPKILDNQDQLQLRMLANFEGGGGVSYWELWRTPGQYNLRQSQVDWGHNQDGHSRLKSGNKTSRRPAVYRFDGIYVRCWTYAFLWSAHCREHELWRQIHSQSSS